jgi:hypothetical protein
MMCQVLIKHVFWFFWKGWENLFLGQSPLIPLLQGGNKKINRVKNHSPLAEGARGIETNVPKKKASKPKGLEA